MLAAALDFKHGRAWQGQAPSSQRRRARPGPRVVGKRTRTSSGLSGCFEGTQAVVICLVLNGFCTRLQDVGCGL